MSPTDDHHSEMNVHRLLDDATAEALLAGRPVPDPALRPVAGLVAEMRSLAREPAPAPSAELAAILAGAPIGAAENDTAATEAWPVSAVQSPSAMPARSGPRALSRLLRNVAAAGLVARVALGAGVAAASMTGAAAAGVLPGPVQDAVAGLMETVTPFEFPRHTNGGPQPPAGVVPGDGDKAPGHPAQPGDVLPGSSDPAVRSAPEPSPPSIAPSTSGGPAPSSPAPAGTAPITGPGATPTAGTGPTPAPGSPPSGTDTTPGTAPVRQPAPDSAISQPSPAPAEPTPSKPEAGSTAPEAATGGTGTAPETGLPETKAPDIGTGSISAPVRP